MASDATVAALPCARIRLQTRRVCFLLRAGPGGGVCRKTRQMTRHDQIIRVFANAARLPSGAMHEGVRGMLLQNEHDLVVLLGAAAVILLVLSIMGGVIAALKAFQVRQFQDLLFKAERKIDTLERRMFNVLNAVPVALVETDATGKFTFANRAAHQLLGRKDNELLGLRFHSATWGITYPDGRVIPADLLPIARTLRGQTVRGFQHMLTRYGAREKILVSVTSMPVMNSVGEVIGSSAAFVELETTQGEGIDDLNGLWRGHWFEAATAPFWGLDAAGRTFGRP